MYGGIGDIWRDHGRGGQTNGDSLAQFAADIAATLWLTTTRFKSLITSARQLRASWPELIQRGLQQRRRTSEGCFSQAVDRRRKVHKSPRRGFAEHAKDAGDAESAFRSDTASCLFVEENEVGLDGLSQGDRRALACLQFFRPPETTSAVAAAEIQEGGFDAQFRTSAGASSCSSSAITACGTAT